MQRRGFRIRFRQVAIERTFDQLLPRDEIRFDVHDSGRSMLAIEACARLIIQHRASRIQHRDSCVLRVSEIFRRLSGGDGLGAHGEERAHEKDRRAPDLGVSEAFAVNPR